jgi:hypothetical protein
MGNSLKKTKSGKGNRGGIKIMAVEGNITHKK